MTALSSEQAAAIEAVKAWFDRAQHPWGPSRPFRLFGPAGTGKTTIAKHLAAALGIEPVFGAYTGKAAKVLRSKGVPATTIHSALYRVDYRAKQKRELFQLRAELAMLEQADGQSIYAKNDVVEEIERLERELRRPAFTLNPESPWAGADLIVLDEVSMVSQSMAQDIERLGVPVLVLGDPAQLPPIEGGGHYTSATPDVLLDQVHRQALESPVLKLATDIRLGLSWKSSVVKTDLDEAMAADQILVWKNATRWNLTRAIRKRQGKVMDEPVPGDRIMCLVNNKDIGIFNGEQFTVRAVRGGAKGRGLWDLDLVTEEGQELTTDAYAGGFIDQEQEAGLKRSAWNGDVGLFTFADVITVHKAQGSEWPHVYVVDQTPAMWKSTQAEKRAWMYTAVSRASEKVTIARTDV